jgi:hypothetical protein
MSLVIYPPIEHKLKVKHQVTVQEVAQAFLNRTGKLATEVRPKNQGGHPRYWFISETDAGRRLKVVYADDPTEPGPVIITAYEPNPKEESLYASF